MHDNSLGGMVDIGENPDAKHSGSCNDGVYGCSRCWNAENDGLGRFCACDWCEKEANTIITKAWDEPCSYALCRECRQKNQSSEQEEMEMDRFYDDENW